MKKMNSVLVEYKRGSRRRPKAVVVAIAPGVIGWSICSKKDTFIKKVGVDLAIERAYLIKSLSNTERVVAYSVVPLSLKSIADRMLQRSYLYFKQEC